MSEELFGKPFRECAVCVVDVETTGLSPAFDEVVEIGFARFENGVFVGSFGTLVKPVDRLIPTESSDIHGITNEMVKDAPSLTEACRQGLSLLQGAQICAYNSPFDKEFIPAWAADRFYPWLDPLTMVRVIDRYARGAGRHKLTTACERHGVVLDDAHRAVSDAKAAGELLYVLATKMVREAMVWSDESLMGEVLAWMRHAQAEQWFNFLDYRSRQAKKAHP